MSTTAASRALDESVASMAHVISPYMGVFWIAVASTLLLTPLLRRLAGYAGIMDWPDVTRKMHATPVAYLGGVAIFGGWLAGLTFGQGGAAAPLFVGVPVSIILGAAVVMFIGLFDDTYSIHPCIKLASQLGVAAALVVTQDAGVASSQTVLELLALPAPSWLVHLLGAIGITVFVLGGCNAFNLLDGMDGLAAGVTVIGCTGLLVMAVIVAPTAHDPQILGTTDPSHEPARLAMCLAIIGALLGFLPYNSKPATIFMGDAGSLLLGYLVVVTILLLAEIPGSGPRLATAALIVFMLPIADTALAVFRRKMRAQPLFNPDSEHLHHMLRRAGLSVRQTVLVLYAAATVLAILGCSLAALELRWHYVFVVLMMLLVVTVLAGYACGQRHRCQGAARTAAAPVGTNKLDHPPHELASHTGPGRPLSEHQQAGASLKN